jgi:hypothetical protein
LPTDIGAETNATRLPLIRIDRYPGLGYKSVGYRKSWFDIMKTLGVILLTLVALSFLSTGGFGLIAALLGGAIGLLAGLFGVVAGLLGGLVGLAAGLFVALLPLLAIVMIVVGMAYVLGAIF